MSTTIRTPQASGGRGARRLPRGFPRLRPLQVIEAESDGERVLILADPARPDGPSLMLSQAAVALACLLDGTRDAEGVAAAFKEIHGMAVEPKVVEHLIDYLDEALLLDSPRFREDLEARREAYRAEPFRAMALGSSVYPADAQGAAAFLDGLFWAPGGPGRLPRGSAKGAPTCVGLVAPHIDFGRGDGLYGQAYLRLAEAMGDAELFVLLGTDHRGQLHDPVTLTALDFQTPFGCLRVDNEAVWDMAQGNSWLENELAHRDEHSLELQAVFLHHLLLHHGKGAGPERAERARVIPVICGSPHGPEEDPGAWRARRQSLDALAVALGASAARQPTCVIVGADLAHLGPAFGAPALDSRALGSLARRDAQTLALVASGDPDGFWADAMEDGNARQICSVTSMYVALRLLEGASGELLGYRQCPVPGEENEGASRVSIAAVAFTRP